MMNLTRVAIHVVFLIVVQFAGAVSGADWPQYRSDAARTAYTAEKLPGQLKVDWVYRPAHPPLASWPNEPRVLYDRVNHVVVADGTLFFGSSADCGVHAIDAATGEAKWNFFTGAPVRCAPAVWNDRLFAGSDDGHLYCLSANDGSLIWKKRAGPIDSTIIGSGRLISRWPVRGGPAIADDVVYFAAGVWPADGTFVYALNAKTGQPLWCNDSAGAAPRKHPHNGFDLASGIGFQGYLAVGKKTVMVPTGRSLAACFDRETGKLHYFRVLSNGGTEVVVVDDLVFDGGYLFNAGDGKLLGRGFAPSALAASPQSLIYNHSATLTSLSRAQPLVERFDEQRKRTETVQNRRWQTSSRGAGGSALIIAGDTVFSAGQQRVVAIDTTTRERLWTAAVDGEPLGMAAAAGRLYVSTDTGAIYCFGSAGGARTVAVKPVTAESPTDGPYALAATEILEEFGIGEGFCVDLGCGDGRLLRELVRNSRLFVCGVESDRAKVTALRARLAAEGLYGTRAVVFHRDPADTHLPARFANLVVSANSIIGRPPKNLLEEAARLQRPWGGVVCTGKPGEMVKDVRGVHDDAGQWTHQYASPAGTTCSQDKLVRGQLSIRWFGGPGMKMPNRHGRAPAPLFFEGRLYVMGLDQLRAMDAYNGRVLWDVPFQGIGKPYDADHLVGAAATGSTFCVAPQGVFVRYDGKCVRLDRDTGERLGEFPLPTASGGPNGEWGFVACADGVLFGSRADTNHKFPSYYIKADTSRLFSESNSLFALDATSGKLLWSFKPQHSIRHNTIAIGDGRIYLIDREPAEECPRYKELEKPHKLGELICLDAKTGKQLWRQNEKVWGTLLALSIEHNVLLMAGQPAFKGFGLTSD